MSYYCDICNKEFKNRKSMTNHRRWHNLPEYKDFQKKFRINQSKALIGNQNCLEKHHSEETKNKMRLSKFGENNPMWKGDNVGYNPLHQWIKRHKQKPRICESCKINKPFDLANISGEYKRDIKDYQWLCRRCHMKSDGRMDNKNEKGQFVKGGIINV